MDQTLQSPGPTAPPATERSSRRFAVRVVLGVFLALLVEFATRRVRRETLDYALVYNLKVVDVPLPVAAEAAARAAWQAYIVAVCTTLALLVLMLAWTPKRRLVYAIRFSLWPLLVSVSYIGIPTALWLDNIPRLSSSSFETALLLQPVLWLFLAPISVPLGYWLCDSRSPEGSRPVPDRRRGTASWLNPFGCEGESARVASVVLLPIGVLAWIGWIAAETGGFSRMKPSGWLGFVFVPVIVYGVVRLLLAVGRRLGRTSRYAWGATILWFFAVASWGFIFEWEESLTGERYAALFLLPPFGGVLAFLLWRWATRESNASDQRAS
jgi:hypothetical protein